jgi:hypothetical protein
MLRLLKRLKPLPPHLHFHVDEAGNNVICDESACRPEAPSPSLLFPRFH